MASSTTALPTRRHFLFMTVSPEDSKAIPSACARPLKHGSRVIGLGPSTGTLRRSVWCFVGGNGRSSWSRTTSSRTTPWASPRRVTTSHQQTQEEARQTEKRYSLHDASFRQRESRSDDPSSRTVHYRLSQTIVSVNQFTLAPRNRLCCGVVELSGLRLSGARDGNNESIKSRTRLLTLRAPRLAAPSLHSSR